MPETAVSAFGLEVCASLPALRRHGRTITKRGASRSEQQDQTVPPGRDGDVSHRNDAMSRFH